MDIPLVTIGITAHNAASTISDAVESAIKQDWSKTEIVIVDDHSTDSTWQIVSDLTIAHKNIRAFRHEINKGVAAARNKIISEGNGDFIVFFDDDDISLPERLTKQYQRLIECEGALERNAPVVCHTARRQIYPDGTSRIEATIGTKGDGLPPTGNSVADLILFNRKIPGEEGSLATCSQMCRKQTYIDLGCFDESFRRAEDTDFCLRLAKVGGYFVGISEPLVIQKMTHASDKKLQNERQSTIQLFNKHKSMFEARGGVDFDLCWINAKYDYLEGKTGKFIWSVLVMAARHPFLTTERLRRALRNVSYNRNLRKFHEGVHS